VSTCGILAVFHSHFEVFLPDLDDVIAAVRHSELE
jgi:hypothetical protein